jgi:hypothetical protein
MGRFVDNTEFVTEECCSCGVAFAMTADLFRRRKSDHKDFYCPNGHGQHYTGKTEAQKLKERLALEQSKSATLGLQLIGVKGRLDDAGRNYSRMRERVKNGVCPCCNRTFQNLLNHIKTKHPDFGSHKVLRSLCETYGLSQAALGDEIGILAAYVSLYENEKKVPQYAVGMIEEWIGES